MSFDPKNIGATKLEPECIIRNPFRRFNFLAYIKEELVQSMRTTQEISGTDDRGPFNNRVYTFVTVPQYFESFMSYGLLQSLDHLLVVYTVLPMRCLLVLLRLLFHLFQGAPLIISKTFKRTTVFLTDLFPASCLHNHEFRDLIRLSLLIICTWLLVHVDSSVVYHEIRTQSVVKIYLFFNLLEVADRLLSAICQDALDDLLHTGSKLSGRFRTSTQIGSTSLAQHGDCVALVRDFLFQYCFALICLFVHCFLLLCQVTTLNVAFNSQNKSLVTVFISNNFVELKSNVFRRMEKTNLFQIACADVRERFHYAVWLCIVVSRNMNDTGWNLDDLRPMLLDVFYIFLAEVAVDWIKHSFITKFNVIASDVYKEYTVSIAYDLLLCRQGQNTADYFDLLSRRMGLTPIPLSCLINVMLLQTVRNTSFLWLSLPVVLSILFLLKIVANLTLLSMAYAHVKAYIKTMSAIQSDAQQQAQGDDNRTDEEVRSNVSREATPEKVATFATSESMDEWLQASELRAPGSFPVRYTGYDQPAKDDQFLHMMTIRHRLHNDSTCWESTHTQEHMEPIHIQPPLADTIVPQFPVAQYNKIPTESALPHFEHRYSPLLVAKESPIRLPYACGQILKRNRSRMTSDNLPSSTNSLLDEGLTTTGIVASSFLSRRDQSQYGESETRPVSPRATREFANQHRCYSIDLGVLSRFRVQLATEPGTNSPVLPNDEVPAPHQRRRKRTRTECSAVESHYMTAEDKLPAMWNQPDGKNFIQPLDNVKLLVKQPLSYVDRYSMIEGQIS